MVGLNRTAAEAMSSYPVRACTDVTGFGLLGHLLEMLKASGISAKISVLQIPLLNGVIGHVGAGIFPGGSLQNLHFVEPHVKWDREITQEMKLYLADAQTSGGLLISLPEKNAEGLLHDLKQSGNNNAAIIGSIVKKSNKAIQVALK
jgi:selenide,water dikinase